MSHKLTVLLGAGASFDCASYQFTECNEDYRPPLVNELFRGRTSFNEILHKYPKAEALSETIRTRIAGGETLEAILREFASEQDIFLKKQYWEIPLYLQEVIGKVSDHFVRFGGSRFSTLVRDIGKSDYQEIMYLTLNYDLFMENALNLQYGVKFDDLGRYCQQNLGWSLIKLHGSVNWGKKLLNPVHGAGSWGLLLDSLHSDLQFENVIQVLDGYQDQSRYVSGVFFYPALAVPLEGKTDFVCHESHIEEARSFLRTCSDFLIIGFSAQDDHILELLEVATEVKKFVVVNGSKQLGDEALGRIATKNSMFSPQNHSQDPVFGGGFGNFMGDNGLQRFLL